MKLLKGIETAAYTLLLILRLVRAHALTTMLHHFFTCGRFRTQQNASLYTFSSSYIFLFS